MLPGGHRAILGRRKYVVDYGFGESGGIGMREIMIGIWNDINFGVGPLFGQLDRRWFIQKSNNIFLAVNYCDGNFKLFRAKLVGSSEREMSFHSQIKHDHERVLGGSRSHE